MGQACHSHIDHSGDPRLRRVLYLALIINAAMFVIEIIASHKSDSLALQADALDFFGDAANYAISLFVLGASIQTRAKASLVKALSMVIFGLWVIVQAIHNAVYGAQPEPFTMGAIGVLALLANLSVAAMLFRYRGGDSNLQSVWLCSRNDAFGNILVVIAAVGVFSSSSHWPDIVVASVVASLALTSAWRVVKLARIELSSGVEKVKESACCD